VFVQLASLHKFAHATGSATPSAQNPAPQLPPPRHAQHIASPRWAVSDTKTSSAALSASLAGVARRLAVQVSAAARPAVFSITSPPR
jgi:hypothetical protein